MQMCSIFETVLFQREKIYCRLQWQHDSNGGWFFGRVDQRRIHEVLESKQPSALVWWTWIERKTDIFLISRNIDLKFNQLLQKQRRYPTAKQVFSTLFSTFSFQTLVANKPPARGKFENWIVLVGTKIHKIKNRRRFDCWPSAATKCCHAVAVAKAATRTAKPATALRPARRQKLRPARSESGSAVCGQSARFGRTGTFWNFATVGEVFVRTFRFCRHYQWAWSAQALSATLWVSNQPKVPSLT